MEIEDKDINYCNNNMRGEPVYEKRDIQITLDRESSKGAFWKMYDRTGRVGTFNKNLTIKLGN